MKVWDYALDRGSSGTNRALAVLKLFSAPVYGDRRCMLSSCQSPVESTDTMIDHFIKKHQESPCFLMQRSAYLRTHFSIWVNHFYQPCIQTFRPPPSPPPSLCGRVSLYILCFVHVSHCYLFLTLYTLPARGYE